MNDKTEGEFLPVSRPYSSERIVSVRGTDGTEGPTTTTPYTRTVLDALTNWSVVTPNITISGTQRSYVVMCITITKS